MESVDDVALLIGQMITMGLPEVLDRHIPRHWKQRGLSWGWTAVIWLAPILTEGDHRKGAVEVYIKGMQHTLSRLTAQVIQPLDFRDSLKLNRPSSMVYSRQLHAGGTSMELTDSLKALFVHTAQSLPGSARRLFMARTVKELGPGGQRQAERELGWNRGTLRKGTG